MKSEYAANISLQTKHQGKSLIVKKQGKHDTITSLLTNWLTKFAALTTLALTVKHFI